MQHATATDVGMRRNSNQDSHAVVTASDWQSWHERGHLFVVADGMGAHAAGELASKLAADGIPHAYQSYRNDSPPDAILKAVRATNQQIHHRGSANTDFHNMGTTASVLLILPQGALVAHVGDSRIYRQRQHVLEQLTFDHSLVWEMRASGQLPNNEEAAATIPANVITRSLGPQAKVLVDLEGPHPIESGDTFLLCSDGLTGCVKDEEIGPLLHSLPPTDAARMLVDLANLRGGPDNITVIIVRVTGPQITTSSASAEPLVVGGQRENTKVRPELWTAMGILAMAMVFFGVAGWTTMAWAVAAVILLLTALVLIQKFEGDSHNGPVQLSNHQLGKGPHTRIHCPPCSDFVSKLENISNQLRDATKDKEWKIDWETFNTSVTSARSATNQKNFADAVRGYAHAIIHIMGELRNQDFQDTRGPLLNR